jgi:transcriptional regulator with XRE-family HTH domain
VTLKHYTEGILQGNFGERLRLLAKEFGSRYALAKSSGIPASTLQSYEGGAKPGMEALLTLARVANVDLNWLMTGKGEMRPPGFQPGAVLKDVLMVDQYELGTALAMEMVIGHIPFSRHFLEARLRLNEPSRETLLAVEAGWNLPPIVRGDLVLVDRKQATFARDGIYLLDLPGLELRAIFRRPDGKADVVAPELDATPGKEGRYAEKRGPGSMEMSISDLFGIGHHAASKVIGRAVWVSRAI